MVGVGRCRFLTTILALHVLCERRELLAKMLQVNRESFSQPQRRAEPPHDSVTDHQKRRRSNLLGDRANANSHHNSEKKGQEEWRDAGHRAGMG